MKMNQILFIVIYIFFSTLTSTGQGKHLFILSGQSNMVRLKPHKYFNPTIKEAFGTGNFIVVKGAWSGKPIRCWVKGWQSSTGAALKADEPFYYDTLIEKVRDSINGKCITSITLLWMQGERDAEEGNGDVYEESLLRLYQQFCTDLGRNDINFVIGRLNDFALNQKQDQYPDWEKIRKAQVKVAESNVRFTWVNTDDLNDGVNRKGKLLKDDLHMIVPNGCLEMGIRFAKRSIELINVNQQ
jgi:hypothetical protein